MTDSEFGRAFTTMLIFVGGADVCAGFSRNFYGR